MEFSKTDILRLIERASAIPELLSRREEIETLVARFKEVEAMLEAAMLFYRAKRMDSETKDYLRTSEKFYSTDIGMRNMLVPNHPDDIDGIMENVVFMELKKRYGTVCTYDVNGREVDFAVWTPRHKAYYQVCSDVSLPSTLKRELAPLRAIDDNYPKYVVCKGETPYDDVDGIRIIDYDEWVKDPF